MEKLLRKADLDALPPFEALKATKILMRSAGKITRKKAFRKDAADPVVRMQLILQLSRALAAQDGKLARKVIRDLPELANCIESHGDRV